MRPRFKRPRPLAVHRTGCNFGSVPRGNAQMATVSQELGEISHCSALLRGARLAGFYTPADFVRLAVARGCRHYAPAFAPLDDDPGIAVISNEELVALLLLGSNEYEPFAIRCAAQLAGSCDAELLALAATRERVERVLVHIAKLGVIYDPPHKSHWSKVIELLGEQMPIADGIMPHWSRFVSQTGVTRSGGGSIQWLHCQ